MDTRETGDEVPVRHLKPAVDPATLTWRAPRRDPFWQRIPAWKDVDEATFADPSWQERHAVINVKRLTELVGPLVGEAFLADVQAGMTRAPMAVRISPYLVALMDWEDPVHDPLRRQFLPLASQLEPDHPMLTLDSLAEQADAPVPGLTHRYPDKVLLLALDMCPVYCRFCTRSYAVGLDTEQVHKVPLHSNAARWKAALRYISERPEVEDVVLSGGDAYRLKPDQLEDLGTALLDIPHIRRIRVATKGPAVLPMKLLGDSPWADAFLRVHEHGRKRRKAVFLHTHFNHPNEVTGFTEDAMARMFDHGVVVRNQAVLQRGVNDAVGVMTRLVRTLGWHHVQSYYVYFHDLVKGTEDLRTSLGDAMEIEKAVRGTTAGFNMPTFVVDAPGGGGKREIHTAEHYDPDTGVAVYAAPSVKPGQLFATFDPLRGLSEDVRAAWQDPKAAKAMLDAALKAARG